ncbi:D-xylulose reductase [Ascochyta rabiei]|uniref:D-xylulose reductase n=1 Tax=Didymella rabiei TaxID=5454 RepID=UPI00220A088E|nr:D-xylulose reductase [Ascochyta rabiei]UPX13099.1 D-xylulose reductase [Ascochyta rabiei]
MRFAAAPGPPNTAGALSKYFRVAEDFVYKLPAGVGLQEAGLVEPLSVVVHAVRLADVRPGETVVVMGSGTIGLLVAAVARQFGAHQIVVIDILEKKSPEEDAKRLLKEFDLEEFGIGTVGGKVDTVIETSGAASSINMGIRLLRPGGKYVQMGVGKAKIEFPIVALSNKQLMFRGCFRYDAGDYELAVKLIAKGLVQVKPLISSVTLFEDATKAWEKTENGEGIENSIEDVKD